MPEGLTRSQQRTDRIYRTPDGDYFISPDGDGRFYAETLEEIRDNWPDAANYKVITLLQQPEDY